jgi:hypothetical protein
MTRGAFRQADMERIFRAAKASGSIVKIDLRTLVVTVLPAGDQSSPGVQPTLAPDGAENWGDD